MLITVDTAANKLAVSKTKIRRMIAAGELPGFKVGHQVRIKSQDLDTVIRRIPTNGDVA